MVHRRLFLNRINVKARAIRTRTVGKAARTFPENLKGNDISNWPINKAMNDRTNSSLTARRMSFVLMVVRDEPTLKARIAARVHIVPAIAKT
jgi:hypothetical protein